MSKDAYCEAPELTPETQKAVFHAQQAYKKNYYKKAASILQKYIEKNPVKNHYLAEFTLANALAMSGRRQEAIEHYRASLALYPDYAPAWQNMGKLYFEEEEYEKAGESILKGYNKSEEKDATLLFYAAVAFIQAKKEKKALPHLENLVFRQEKNPKTEWLEALLNTYVEVGETEKTYNVIRKLMALNKEEPKLWKLMAQLHLQQKHYKQAAAAFTIYSYMVPLSREENLLLGDLYYTIGIPSKAAFYYEKAFDTGRKPEDYEKLASAYLAAYQLEKANIILEEGLKQRSTPELWFLKGQLYYGQNQFDRAFEAFEKSARLNPGSGRADFMMGYCALQMEKKSIAVAALKRAARHPRHSRAAQKILRQIESQ